jgi:hypothetical protein
MTYGLTYDLKLGQNENYCNWGKTTNFKKTKFNFEDEIFGNKVKTTHLPIVLQC